MAESSYTPALNFCQQPSGKATLSNGFVRIYIDLCERMSLLMSANMPHSNVEMWAFSFTLRSNVLPT